MHTERGCQDFVNRCATEMTNFTQTSLTQQTLTCTKKEIMVDMKSMGVRRMLNRDKVTKALLGSRKLLG